MRAPPLVALAMVLPVQALAEVAVTDPWARASILASRPGAAYLTLESAEGDRLVEAQTPVADRVTIHAAGSEGGISRMVHLEALDLPAGQAVTLAPGGMHLMLMGLTEALQEGSSFPLTLRLESAGEVTVEVPVLAIAAAGPGEAGR